MAAPTIWQRAGAMLVNIDHDASLQAKELWDAGFRAIFPQTHEGTKPRHSDPKLVMDYLKPYRERGFVIGHWGYLTGADVVGEAKEAIRWDGLLASTFYVPNAEIEYKYTDGNGQPNPAHFARSQEWVTAYLANKPKGQPRNIGLSTYGRLDQADIHYSPWLNQLMARALPQAYVNEQGTRWTPENCYKGAIDVKQPHNKMYKPGSKPPKTIPGFPKSYVHVSIAKPDPDDAFPLVIEDWIDMLVEAKAAGHTMGFSIYEGENFTATDLGKLGDAIRQHKLAAV